MILGCFFIIFCYGEIIFVNTAYRARLHKSIFFEKKERLTFGKIML